MNRKFTAPALALALMGGVYMAAGTANASNMGFKLERSFAHADGLKNIYFVSFPLFNGVGDVCDETGGASSNVCTGQIGEPGDGMITPCDAACDLFTDISTLTGNALVSMTRINDSCAFADVSINKNFLGISLVAGGGQDLEALRETGWQVSVTQDQDSDNRSVIVGSHDPSFTGTPIPAFDTCDKSMINLPYHSMYQTSYEVFCGLEITDWVDDNGDGKPDTCTAGIFDDASGAQVSLTTFDTAGNLFQSAIVLENFLGLQFPTAEVNLAPGEGYFIQTSSGYAGRNWLSPHF